MNLVDLRGYLSRPNVAAFLRVIREKESAQDDTGYFMRWPGKSFSDLTQHPNILEPIPGTTLKSSAAGAYQITGTTWRALCQQYPFPDFSRDSQDLAAVALVAGRGALPDVLAGRIDAAIIKCRQEWTSLPGAAESRGSWTMDKARAVFLGYGGGNSAPPPLTQRKENAMPIFAALLPTILGLIPQLAAIFKPGSEVASRNVAAATAVAETLIKATESVNLEDAVTKMQDATKPEALAAATQAVQDNWYALVEVGGQGGGIDMARRANNDANAVPFYKSAAFVMACILTPIIYMVVYRVLWGEDYSEQLRTVVVTAVLSGLLGAVTGYFFGAAWSQRGNPPTTTKGQQ